MLRNDFNDQIFRTENEKYNAITKKQLNVIVKVNQFQSAQLAQIGQRKFQIFLKIKNFKHNILNAKQHEKEAKVIAEAEKVGAVTVATNMAGRGTDIKLGGNKDYVESGETPNVIEQNKR